MTCPACNGTKILKKTKLKCPVCFKSKKVPDRVLYPDKDAAHWDRMIDEDYIRLNELDKKSYDSR